VSARGRLVLAINCGSSSIKASTFSVTGDRAEPLARVTIEGIGEHAKVQTTSENGSTDERPLEPSEEPLQLAIATLCEARDPDVVGHRIVHGGANHAGAARIDVALVEELERLAPLAPLHQAMGLRGVALVAEKLPQTPQVACFDTAFHRSMPLEAQRLTFPAALFDAGIRRYGFHGLSCQHVVHAVGADRLGRAIIAHLGSGASLTAVRDGRSVDTTMSFTPTGGLMMATRSGDVDPSVLVYLLRQRGFDVGRLEHLVEHESGLLGVSGSTGDMRTLLARKSADPAAALAIDMFCREASKQIGALTAVLGGLDTLVFTGAIGTRAAPIRASICHPLAHLGIAIDATANERAEDLVSTRQSRCAVRVVPTGEDLVIARQAAQLVAMGGP
jgi:acetate kinase